MHVKQTKILLPLLILLPYISLAQAFTYDTLNRITRVTISGCKFIEYQYDQEGNRTGQQVTIITPPSLSVTASPNAVCKNATITFSASGANTYTWSGPNLNTASGASVTANPATVGVVTYTVVGTSNGCSSTQAIQVTVNDITSPGCITAVSNINGVEEFTAVPNPNNGVFSVRMKFTSLKNVQFVLINQTGQIVYQSSVFHYTGTVTKDINVTYLSSGVYELKAMINDKAIIQKVVISR